MDTLAQELLADCDDRGFCEGLVAILQNPSSRGLALMFEEWVLARLRLVHARSTPTFFGVFVAPMRARYPHEFVMADLFASMEGVTEQPQTAGGDVEPTAFMAAIDEVFLHGLPKGHETGWHTLTPYYTVRRGEFTAITGISTHMKSTFVHSLCLNLARQHGWNFSLFNPEHHPLGSLGSWLVEAYAGQAQHAMEEEDRRDAKAWVAEHFHLIAPPDEVPPTLDWVLAVARLQKERYGIDGIVIDPWNEVEHLFGSGKTETQYISECLSKVRRFARTHSLHVWIVAHPTKLQKAVSGKYSGQYPPPTPYDVSGGAHWFNKPDNFLSIWRDALNDSPVVEVHIYKVRNRAVGHVGKIELRYNGRQFQDIGDMTTPHWTDRD